MKPLSVAFFGSSLVSAYWNGAATYYRGVLQAFAANGHRITFYEPDAYDRQKHRDIADPAWARVVVYPAEGEGGVARALDEARAADLIVKASARGRSRRIGTSMRRPRLTASPPMPTTRSARWSRPTTSC
jgi:spore maturation protein CgeB